MRQAPRQPFDLACDDSRSPRSPRSPRLPPLANLVDIPRPIAGFACARCHRVRFFTRVRAGEAWNQLIAYLTAGLLYGREVPRPPWFTAQRRKPYKPRPGAPPARRRAQVRQRLVRGDAIATIAADLRLAPASVTPTPQRRPSTASSATSP